MLWDERVRAKDANMMTRGAGQMKRPPIDQLGAFPADSCHLRSGKHQTSFHAVFSLRLRASSHSLSFLSTVAPGA